MENPFYTQNANPQRPPLLLIICILTFIGSGWGILGNLINLFTTNITTISTQLIESSNFVEDQTNSNGFDDLLFSSMNTINSLAEHAKTISIIQLILSLISLLGAILMFNLKRIGFYLYTAVQISALFVTPYFAGFTMFTIIGMLWAAFISLVFIILYAINLKYMR